MYQNMFFIVILIFSYINCYNASLYCDILEKLANNVNAKCKTQLHTVCNNAQLGWTMYDASSKFLTSGMSYSNVIDYGNFPECLSIDHEDSTDGRIIGKYCGLSILIVDVFLTPQTQKIFKNFNIDINATAPQMVSWNNVLQMDKQLRDVLIEDVPFVISKYSMCIPDACTPREVGYFYGFGYLENKLLLFTDITCETKESNTRLETVDILFIVFLGVIVLLMIASSLYDALCQNFRVKPHHPLFLSFSVLYNGKKLLQISNNKTEQIQCFNGMRFISMMWVVAYHAVVVYQAGAISLENYPEVVEWNHSWTNRYILSGVLAVDTFFFISGFLLAFTYIRKATEEDFVQQAIKVPKMYLHRYLRLTPAMGVMFLVTVTIFRFLGSGPTWSFVTDLIKQTCLDHWWQFFLYIQNYTDPDNMCVNPMWYLSADMQMFILAPLVLIPTALFIRKKFWPVVGGLIGLTVFWVFCPMFIRYFKDGEPGNIYTAHERFNNFLIGITFGAVMRLKKDKPFIFSPMINFLLWILVIVVSLAFNIFWYDVLTNYEFVKYTLFMGFYRPIWCLCLVFMVYSCYHNHGGIIQWFLTRPSFQILGRLSYSMYVVHFLVEVYAGLTGSTSTYFSNYMLFYHWCGHIIVTLVVSVFWVLAFEFPMMTIDKYLLDGDWLKRKPKLKSGI